MSDLDQYSRLPGEEEEEPKPRRFRLFDSQREGKGVTKEDAKITPDLGGFFRSLRRNFTKLLSVNLFTVIGNIPILFALLALSGAFKVEYLYPVSGYFIDLRTLMLLGDTADPATMALFGALGRQKKGRLHRSVHGGLDLNVTGRMTGGSVIHSENSFDRFSIF